MGQVSLKEKKIFVKNNFRSFPYFEIMLDGTEANLELKKTQRYSFTLYYIFKHIIL